MSAPYLRNRPINTSIRCAPPFVLPFYLFFSKISTQRSGYCKVLSAGYVTSAAQTQPRIVDVGTGSSSDGLSNCIRHFVVIKIYNVNFQTHENGFLLFLSFFFFLLDPCLKMYSENNKVFFSEKILY